MKKLVTGQDADPKEVARGEKLVTDLLMILDRQLEGREWLAQDRVTLADYAVASTVFARARIKLPSLPPRVAAWIERVESQSAWKQAEKLG
ncbi:MAG TPA: glutathione binding-like protein [Polyangiaceae bacterium]|nr:glutathione binding-like protein [Polyangiaceae bacterium]